MSKRLDLTGQRFTRLLVIEFAYVKKQATCWKCLCDCGNIVIVHRCNLKSGLTKSCGCLKIEIVIKRNKLGPSEETIKKMRANSPNYNPNLTDEDRINRRDIPGYKEWVKAVYERDNYTCQVCGQVGGKLVAHHLESYNCNPKLRTKLSNGTTVCEKHHKDFHHIFGYGNNTKKQFIQFKEEY